MIHFEQTSLLTAEVVIKVDNSMNVKDLKEIAKKLRYDIMKEIDIKNVEIHLDLGSDAINVEKPLSSNIQSPANNQIGSSEIKFA